MFFHDCTATLYSVHAYLKEAWDTLKNSARRKEYDRTLSYSSPGYTSAASSSGSYAQPSRYNTSHFDNRSAPKSHHAWSSRPQPSSFNPRAQQQRERSNPFASQQQQQYQSAEDAQRYDELYSRYRGSASGSTAAADDSKSSGPNLVSFGSRITSVVMVLSAIWLWGLATRVRAEEKPDNLRDLLEAARRDTEGMPPSLSSPSLWAIDTALRIIEEREDRGKAGSDENR